MSMSSSRLFRLTTIRRLATSKSRVVSSTSYMSAAEREEALKAANEKMKAYHLNRPPIEVLQKSRRRSKQRDAEHRSQIALVGSFLIFFVGTPFLGHKIATDREFRERVVPSWYDFSIETPKSEWSRAQLHEDLVNMQTELHERAIRGEFSKEKLEEMRRHYAEVDSPWDNDEDDDDDDEEE